MSLPGRSHAWVPRTVRSTAVVSGLSTQVGMRATAEGVLSAVSTGKTVELVRGWVTNVIERHGSVSTVWSNGGEVSRVMGRMVRMVMSVMSIVKVRVVAGTSTTVIDSGLMGSDDFLLLLSLSPLLAKFFEF